MSKITDHARSRSPLKSLSLFPGKSIAEVAALLASHFNRISSVFEPLQTHQIPTTYWKTLPTLQLYEVAGRIRAFKKPKSMVRGDIFPSLVAAFGDLLAGPLSSIYNAITVTRIWPRLWKQEFVTTIPKATVPEGINDLRNISCTMLPSKIYESYVLNWVQDKVKLRPTQYGGVKGCSTAHLLVGVLDEVALGLEGDRAAVTLTSIDYAKAFNRLTFSIAFLLSPSWVPRPQ